MTSVLWKADLKTWVVFKQRKQHQTLLLLSILADNAAPFMIGEGNRGQIVKKSLKSAKRNDLRFAWGRSLTVDQKPCSLGNDLTQVSCLAQLQNSGNILKIWNEPKNLTYCGISISPTLGFWNLPITRTKSRSLPWPSIKL